MVGLRQSLAPLHVFLILFAWMGVLVIRWLEGRTERWWPFACVQGYLALGYESTHLQFLALGLGAVGLVQTGRTRPSRVWKAMGILAAAQAAGLTYRALLASAG